MLLVLWSPKGGSGTSVVAAGLGAVLAARGGALLVDLAGDLPAVCGLPPEAPGSRGASPARPDTLAAWMAQGAAAPSEALDRLGREVAPGLGLLALEASPAPSFPAEAGAALAAALADGPPTVADAGSGTLLPFQRALVEVADASVVVVRGCYLALRRALTQPLVEAARGVVLVEEPGRALGEQEVAEVLGRPVLARIPLRASIARAVDAGVLVHRLPPPLPASVGVLGELLDAPATGRVA